MASRNVYCSNYHQKRHFRGPICNLETDEELFQFSPHLHITPYSQYAATLFTTSLIDAHSWSDFWCFSFFAREIFSSQIFLSVPQTRPKWKPSEKFLFGSRKILSTLPKRIEHLLTAFNDFMTFRTEHTWRNTKSSKIVSCCLVHSALSDPCINWPTTRKECVKWFSIKQDTKCGQTSVSKNLNRWGGREVGIIKQNSLRKPGVSGLLAGLWILSRSPSSLVCPSIDSSFAGGDSDAHAGLDESVRNDSLPVPVPADELLPEPKSKPLNLENFYQSSRITSKTSHEQLQNTHLI